MFPSSTSGASSSDSFAMAALPRPMDSSTFFPSIISTAPSSSSANPTTLYVAPTAPGFVFAPLPTVSPSNRSGLMFPTANQQESTASERAAALTEDALPLHQQMAALSMGISNEVFRRTQQGLDQSFNFPSRQMHANSTEDSSSRMRHSSSSASSTVSSHATICRSQQPSQPSLQQSQPPSTAPSTVGGAPFIPHTGMKDVPIWLKRLRLHKYNGIIADLTYTELMNLNEGQLDKMGVTKGARTKILQSIVKLKQRASHIKRIVAAFNEKNVCLSCSILEMKQLVASPIWPYWRDASEELQDTEWAPTSTATINNENIPGLMMCLLYRIYLAAVSGDTLNKRITPELLLTFFTICDKILSNEAFTSSQKRKVGQWRRAGRRFGSPQELRLMFDSRLPQARCAECHPSPQYYSNKTAEEIRMQNLQLLVKQYLAQGGDLWQVQQPILHSTPIMPVYGEGRRSTYGRPQPNFAYCNMPSASMYSRRPSALARKLLPRGGAVSEPPGSKDAYDMPSPSARSMAAPLGRGYSDRYAPRQTFPKPASFQPQAHSNASSGDVNNKIPTKVQESVPPASHNDATNTKKVSEKTPSSSPWQYDIYSAYASHDLLEFEQQLPLFGTPPLAHSLRHQYVWNVSVSEVSPNNEVVEKADSVSGYSSGSERGSGAGSPGSTATSPTVAPAANAISPSPLDEVFEQAARSSDNDLIVFDFCRRIQDANLDTFCRTITAGMVTESA